MVQLEFKSEAVWLQSPCFTCISSYEISIGKRKCVVEGRRGSLGKYIWKMLQTTSCPRYAQLSVCEWNLASPRIPTAHMGHLTLLIRKAMPSPIPALLVAPSLFQVHDILHPKGWEIGEGEYFVWFGTSKKLSEWQMIPENRFFPFSLKQKRHMSKSVITYSENYNSIAIII